MLETSKSEEGESNQGYLAWDGFFVESGDIITISSVGCKIADPVDNGYTVECNLIKGA